MCFNNVQSVGIIWSKPKTCITCLLLHKQELGMYLFVQMKLRMQKKCLAKPPRELKTAQELKTDLVVGRNELHKLTCAEHQKHKCNRGSLAVIYHCSQMLENNLHNMFLVIVWAWHVYLTFSSTFHTQFIDKNLKHFSLKNFLVEHVIKSMRTRNVLCTMPSCKLSHDINYSNLFTLSAKSFGAAKVMQ